MTAYVSTPGDELVRRRLNARLDRQVTIPRSDGDSGLPLSFDQERLLFLSELEPTSPAYLVPLSLRFRGPLKFDALAAAWNELRARHEILRTRFRLSAAGPVQDIEPVPDGGIPVTDLTGSPAPEREKQARELVREDLQTPIDLTREHPVRARLIRLDDEDQILAVVLHHIACDDQSVRILTDDLGALYAAQLTGEPAGLPPLPVRYADYAAWQRERLSGAALDSELKHWRDRLSGLSPLVLPTDRPRPPVRGWAGGRVDFSVPAGTAERLRALAQEQGCTVFTVLLTAFQVLLSRLSGQPDVTVGSAVARRDRPEVRRVAGFFLNTLVLRAAWSGDPQFAHLLQRNHERMLDALDHREIPVHRLVDELDPERDLSRTPLFQVMFDRVDTAAAAPRLPGVTAEPFEVTGAVAKFDLTFQVGEAGDGTLTGVAEYAADLFDPDTVRNLTARYTQVLEAVATDPRQTISALPILSGPERTQLLDEWNDTRHDRPWASVPARLTGHATDRPDSPALLLGDTTMSYRELDDAANRLAHHLREYGVGPETVAGVCLDRGTDLVVALLAVWKAGGAYVPLDPAHPDERLGHILTDSGAAVLITDSASLTALGDAPAGVPRLLIDAEREAIGRRPATDPAVTVGPDALAYVIYTSGTTGRPKGVLVEHGSLMNYLDFTVETYLGDSADPVPLFASMAFDLAVPNLWTPLCTGRPVRLLPARYETDELGPLLAASAPYAFIKLTPAHLDVLAGQLTAAQAATLARTVVAAGDGFSLGLLNRWRTLSGGDHQLINEYGPTEITVGNSIYTVAGEEVEEPLPIGRPIANTTAYVLDEHLRPVPPGVVGEVYVGGVGVARGYRNRPALTADKFRPDPYGRVPGGRLYRTGDLARVLPGGDFAFVRRADDQIKIRGYRIEPGEVTAALTAHPGVREALVLVDNAGRDARLVAYLVADGVPPEPGELRDFLAGKLPDYMIPSRFVGLDAFRLTENGKVDRRALPASDEAALRPRSAATPPRNALEARLAGMWQSVLGVEDLGVHDSFFDVGGDSIRAVRLVGALRETGLDISVRDLFQERTVARLAEVLSTREATATDAALVRPFELLDPADRAKLPDGLADAFPLSEIQAGMVFEMLSDPDAPYHNCTSYQVRDGRPLVMTALREAAQIVVARHEALRTSIDLSTGSQPLQLIHERAEMPVGSQDLRGLPADEQTRRIERHMAAERTRLFDFDKPSLMRLFAHDTSDDSWWITITECHPVIEGWGYHLMLMEVLTAYRALLAGQEPELPPLPAVRYADFIAAELAALRSAEDRDYWRGVVTGVTPLTLPAAWGGGETEESPVYDVEVPFHDLRDALLALARTADVPLKSILHAAHLKVMSMLTTEPAFSSGLVCDARPEVAGADRVFGMYLNTVPFAFRPGAATWGDLIREVFASEVELWPHRRFPVSAMQRELGGGRRVQPILFNYLDFNTVDTDLVDIDAGIDYSPNEFHLVVTATRAGMVRISAKPETVSRPFGALLGSLYRQVLEQMAAGPDGDARRLRLPGAEWDRVVRRWNQTDVPWPETMTHELFEQWAARQPDAVAVREPAGATVTYAELNEQANRIAWHLRGLGVGREDFVGVCLEHSVPLLATLLGILKAGAAYVPLDPAQPAQRLAFMLADTGARVVVTTGPLRAALPTTVARIVTLDGDAEAIAVARTDNPALPAGPDDLAYTMYTSGSTGKPKGVLISHRGLNNYLLWAVDGYGLDGARGAPMLGSVAFDLSIPNFFLPLTGGRDVTLIEPDPSLGTLARLLSGEYDFSLLKITPAHLDVLRTQLPADARIRSVRTFVVGADEVRPETVVAWRRHAPDARIINEYGPTETVVGCSTWTVPEEFDPSAPVPIGRPIANIRMYVLDAAMDPVPTGVVGELYIGGVGVARGYLNRPGLTADRFRPDPFATRPGERFYRTGDLARFRADGDLEFLGRIDNQVKIRGYRIELGEVEAQLLLHPKVRDGVVAANNDRRGDRRLVAYLVPEGTPPSAAELRAFLARSLPAYMLPARFVVLDALPLSQGGKVDRARLPAANDTAAGQDNYLAPRTEQERTLAGIWAEVLGVPRVGVRDSFLDLGGHSLAALRVAARVRGALSTAVSTTALLTATTVEEQAARLHDHTTTGPLVPIRPGGARPPLILVHPAGGNVLCYTGLAAHLADAGQPVYGLVAAGLDGAGEPLATVEEMAADYLRAVEEAGLLKAGEIVLGGWSMGGLVAYEMARTLGRKTGVTPPLLLLDGYPPGAAEDRLADDDAAFLSWFAYDWGQNLGHELAVPEKELAGAATFLDGVALVLDRARAAGAAGLELDAATLARVAAVVRANVRAANRYRPEPGHTGPITVLAAEAEPGAADPAHGWPSWTSGVVRGLPVPGDHYGILQKSHLQALADVVVASLDTRS